MWTSLVGFMGSGKSRVAGILSRWTGWTARDLDLEIEASAGLAIPEIFARHGEARFRALESAALAALPAAEPLWLATGGGCVEDPANVALLRARGLVVWLDAPWETLRGRIERDGPRRRPLVEHLGWDGLERLHRRRQRLYARAADFRLRADQADAPTVARTVQLRGILWRDNQAGASR
jgi:shikimate kinase